VTIDFGLSSNPDEAIAYSWQLFTAIHDEADGLALL